MDGRRHGPGPDPSPVKLGHLAAIFTVWLPRPAFPARDATEVVMFTKSAKNGDAARR